MESKDQMSRDRLIYMTLMSVEMTFVTSLTAWTLTVMALSPMKSGTLGWTHNPRTTTMPWCTEVKTPTESVALDHSRLFRLIDNDNSDDSFGC